MRHVIDQQMQLMAQQLALLSGGAAGAAAPAMAAPAPLAATAPAAVAEPQPTDDAAPKAVDDEEAAIAHTTYDTKKAFGAITRIDTSGGKELGLHQRRNPDAFIERSAARTRTSQKYQKAHHRHHPTRRGGGTATDRRCSPEGCRRRRGRHRPHHL